jgi:hypothetical protein
VPAEPAATALPINLSFTFRQLGFRVEVKSHRSSMRSPGSVRAHDVAWGPHQIGSKSLKWTTPSATRYPLAFN